ncbi:MAG: T9SS type A sorting domain-containing protein, partial [Bacteroidales bacterium]|nr:T9SS type A sorting domain-containing protein [Bacteroidales bacterium]
YLYDGGDRAYYATLPGSPGLQYEWILEDAGSGQVEIRNAGTNEYMHIENQTGYIQCTSRTPGWGSSRWVLEDAGDGFIRFQNVWQPAQYAHIENLLGYAQHGTISTGWWSAMWAMEVVPKNASPDTHQSELTEINIYPNPAQDYVMVDLRNFENSNMKINLIDITGQLINNMNVQGGVIHELNFSGLNTGTYFIQIMSTDSVIFKKLIID